MRCPHCGGSANQHRVEIKRLQKQHEDFLHEFWETNAENERLRKALAESCDENRLQVIEEGPWSTDTCPIAGKLNHEIERLRKGWESLEWESKREIERLRMSLEWWGRHLYNCASQNDMDCDCGFSEALEGGE